MTFWADLKTGEMVDLEEVLKIVKWENWVAKEALGEIVLSSEEKNRCKNLSKKQKRKQRKKEKKEQAEKSC